MSHHQKEAGAHHACLLLGSNIQPEQNLPRAVKLLRHYVVVEKASTVWETSPVGSPGPNFLNMAVMIWVSLDRRSFKAQVLRSLEAQLGRVRTPDKYAARTIDIDIIIWDSLVVEADVWKFAHIAAPVAELLPHLRSEETGEILEQAARRLAGEASIRKRTVIGLDK